MTPGRGFVAVALVIFAAWNPLGAMVGRPCFSAACSPPAPTAGRGVGISPFFLDALPYVVDDRRAHRVLARRA